jgi:hypothetical protein
LRRAAPHLLTALAVASPLAAQGLGTLATVAGQVVDLAAENGANTSFLYGTSAGAVGRVHTSGAVQQLGSGVVGAPGNLLRAVVSLPDASVAALDTKATCCSCRRRCRSSCTPTST